MFSPRKAVAPKLTVDSSFLLTSGGELLATLEGCGRDADALVVLFNGTPVQAEFVKTSGGLKLKVSIPPGLGGG
jgi:hypothetical protein